MVVLGIDPGIKRTGYAVVEARGGMAVVRVSGVLSTSPRAPFHERLKYIHHGLTEIVTRFQPDEIAVEDVFVKNNVRVALRMGHVRGVALLVAATHSLCDLAWDTLVSFLTYRSRRLWTPRVHRVVFGACGLVLIGFGVYFAVSAF